MAIKLAFSTTACPDWSIEDVARRAAEMGYQGVELRTLGKNSSGLASDPVLSESGKVASVLKAAGIEPVCLSTSLALNHKHHSETRAAVEEASRAVALAAEIGCTFVRVFGYELRPGENRQAALECIAASARKLGEVGAEHGVQVLLENGGSFNKAKEWWWVMNLVEHPMVGVAWNAANGAANGEPVSVAVPVLNSRIRLAKVKDTVLGEGSGFVPLGEGTVGIKQFIHRLLGIGYDGYVSVEWDRLWLPSLTPAEEYLPDAQKRLRGWLDEVAKAIEDAKPKPKGAAKPKAVAAH
ncbi:MAG: sugar phosphate isomerase/epimerase [Planctomycetes bacterium]|nr:sugar phosphate isomerase/epimerase [Planctomycetota bacterium]